MGNLSARSPLYLISVILSLTIFLGYSESWFLPPAAAAPTTFIVFNTNDAGAGSLRQAIISANGNPGVDTINFNLPLGGVQTITPGSPLPTITDPLIIDGYSQFGTSQNNQADGNNAVLSIEIDGTNLPLDPCLWITAGGSTVRGLVINRWRSGIRLETGGGNTIQGNFFGTDPSGAIRRANTLNSVDIIDSPANTIGGTTPAARNLISGSNSQGILIRNAGSTGNVVAGNFIGTNAAGTAAFINGVGVSISAASGNTIGGTAAGARNLISGNSTGIAISSGSTANAVAGNFIGTDSAGTGLVGNTVSGVSITAPGNTIGGTTAAARNVICGNGNGLLLGSGATLNVIQGNYIGVNAPGSVSLGNGRGVLTQGSAGDNLIGGTVVGARNVISGNSFGLFLSSISGGVNTRVEGNFIGTDPAGTAGMPNVFGVIVVSGSSNIIGGMAADAGNLLAFNGSNVHIEPTAFGNGILANSMFSDGQIGIDLNGDFITSNDAGDRDTGGNNLQNYPVLTSATSTGGDTTIGGILNSTPSTSFRIEFFSSTILGPVGFGQGQTFIGSTTVTTDASGDTNFAITAEVATPAGQFITATATDNTTNDTSEFSAGVQVNGPETFQFSQLNFATTEHPDGSAIIVTRTNGAGGGSSVNYATSSGTAQEGIDYIGKSGTLFFGAGETSMTINVSIIDDVLFEGDEFFNISLSNPSMGAVLGTLSLTTVTIADTEQTIYGVTSSNMLISFESASPQTLYSRVQITGLQPSEQILGIDFRPSNGLLYGLGNSSRLYTIDTATGAATEVGAGSFSPALSGTDFGFDFNPVVDLIRVVSNTDANFRLNPDTGVVVGPDTTLAYAASDPNAAANPNVVGLAYTSNSQGAASTTTLYGIDSNLDTLVRIGSLGGTPTSPNSGELVTIGPLATFSIGALTAFDIPSGGDTAFAALTPQGAPFSILQRISLTTGAAMPIDEFSGAPFIGGAGLGEPVRAIAVATNGSIEFASPTVTVSEGAGRAQITLNRTGDISGPASVDFTTSDGTAVQTSDYGIAFGTVTFGGGDATSSFFVPITDDGYLEADETFTVSLNNPKGGFQLGGIASATVTITENDLAPSATNPIEAAPFFVRQHYIDFLSREPDTSGFNFWVNEITSCGTDAQCIEIRRVNVSAAFFLSIEFQRTGALVYLTHKAAVGSNFPGAAPVPVLYLQFEDDAQTIQQGLIFGQPDFELRLEINTQAFMADFVSRASFEVAFPITLTPAQFVDALIANTGVAFTDAERIAAISEFFFAPTSVDRRSRALALRRIVTNSAFAAAEFNRTFVAMEYFGYLRRDPDAPGFNFWLNKLNSFNGNFIDSDMVKSFITSGEYRERFGAN